MRSTAQTTSLLALLVSTCLGTWIITRIGNERSSGLDAMMREKPSLALPRIVRHAAASEGRSSGNAKVRDENPPKRPPFYPPLGSTNLKAFWARQPKPAFRPYLDVKPSHLVKGKLFEYHKKISEIMNSSKIAPTPRLAEHFPWLKAPEFSRPEWYAHIDNIIILP